jgi:hypothetical protein
LLILFLEFLDLAGGFDFLVAFRSF